MIMANEAVAKKFSSLPFLYRVHDEPDPDALLQLQETLLSF
jgi:exoribonuclease R